ncbi:MAG: hypothetical protein WC505_06210 [Patescibacteria group bacterium]
MPKHDAARRMKLAMVSLSGLKSRGWNPKLIERWLGDAHVEADNPHYKCAAPMLLYYVSHVEALENLPEVRAAVEKTLHRSQAIRQGKIDREPEQKRLARIREAELEAARLIREQERNARRKQKREAREAREAIIMEEIWSRPITVPSMPMEELTTAALRYRNAWNKRQIHVNQLTRDAERDIQLEYIQYSLVRFKQDKNHGRLTTKNMLDFYKILNVRIYKAISEAYPALADYCKRCAWIEFGNTVALVEAHDAGKTSL